MIGLALVASLGICAARGLRLTTTRVHTRDLAHDSRSTFMAVRPTTGLNPSAKVHAAIPQGEGNDLFSVRDIIYMATVSLAGKEYAVQIDTGSSDMWIRGNAIAGAQVSSILTNITYGIGWAAGPIAQAGISFAGFNITSQAFLMATSSNNPILDWGAEGLLGLGINSLSTIDHLVNSTGNSWGRTLLHNIFSQSPTTPNFIAFLLQRSEHSLEVQSEGSFTIGELEPKYEAAIRATDVIPTWPTVNPSRWSILLDGYDTTGAMTHSFESSVPNVPRGKAVALLDSGTTYSYAPEEFCRNLYSSVPGAIFSNTLGQWVLPCQEEVNLGFSIQGRRFPIHPLDIISPSLFSTDNSTCYGTFIPHSFSVGEGEFDILLGDMFLRNVYSMYDLGDFEDNQNLVMGNPYLKLLSITNATLASQEFHQIRGGSATEANKISNAQTSGSAYSSSDIWVNSATLDRLVRYAEIMLSLLAVATTLLVLIAGTGVYLLFFKRRRGGSTRQVPDDAGHPAFALGNLRPPGAQYHQVPSARSSIVP